MRRRYLLLAPAAAAVLVLRSQCGGAPEPASSAAAVRSGRIPDAHRPAGSLVSRARYRLAYEQQVTAAGREPVKLRAEGAWIATPRADGRTEVRFDPAVLDGPSGELPRASELAGSVQLVREDGVLSAIGFPEGMPARAKKLLTGLATTFQHTERPGQGWSVSEEDLTGRYDAVYVRSDDGIARTRPRYTALRGPTGLAEDSAAGATPAEQSRFVVDAHGVITARIELDLEIAIGEGMAPMQLRLRASLEREAIEQVPAPGGPAFAAAPISGHADFEGARRNADESFVAGATVEDLLAEVKRSVALAGRDGGNARAQVLARLAALIRLDPEVAAQVAEHLREHAGELAEARLLAGALASTRIAAGTDALAGLAGDELPEDVHGAVMGALSLSNPATPASLAALSAGLDRPHGPQAALGLGTHGRKSRERDPAAADGATALLLERHAQARTDAERKLYLEALGNSGAVRALPALRAAIDGGDRRLGSAAAFSLRFVPGADVDALLEKSIQRPELAFAAIRAAAYRDPVRWRPLLAAAQELYPEHDGIQGEIRATLRRWR